MTLFEKIEYDMRDALRSGDKFKRSVLSNVIAKIKETAINKGADRINISDEIVNECLLKYKKMLNDILDNTPQNEQTNDVIQKVKSEMDIVNIYAPSLITDENKIREIMSESGFEICSANRGKIMKYLSTNYKGKIDMAVASKLFN